MYYEADAAYSEHLGRVRVTKFLFFCCCVLCVSFILLLFFFYFDGRGLVGTGRRRGLKIQFLQLIVSVCHY